MPRTVPFVKERYVIITAVHSDAAKCPVCCGSSEYEAELQALSGVRDELEMVSSDKSTLEKELSNFESKHKVMETLRESQETELQTLKVGSLWLEYQPILASIV